MRKILIVLCALFAATGAIRPATANSDSPYGLWLTEKKGAMVNVYDCGGALCARTVWLKKPLRKDGSARFDTQNPDPALRSRPWCGIEVITGAKPDGPGEWKRGKFYAVKNGKTYDIDMTMKKGRMRVRGYLGTPLVGRSEKWSRPDPGLKPQCGVES